MNPLRSTRFPLQRVAMAAALACGVLLTACGGGSDTPPDTQSVAPLSQPDATGALVSGAWTVVRPHATIVTTVANGTVVLTVDDGNDGTIDHTWTFTAAQLNAAAG